MLQLVVTLLFWAAIAAALLAQVRILQSTRRVLATAAARTALEWGFALVPATALVLTLILAWRAAVRPPVIEVDLPAAPGEVRS
ncbi:MAG: hypothetical protein RL340_1097 [Gemmatimonadota bacterium]|jgi:phage-related tail protein